MGGRVRNTGKYYRVHFLSCDGIMWNHTGAGYREYSRKGRENGKEVERFSRFCEEFANYEREPGQDMTLLVTADGKDSRKAWDFQKPVEEDLILYAGWYDQENTSYTVRHVIRGEDDPFREEERAGKAGDTFFARGLCPGEEGCPAGYSLENGGTGQKVTLEKEAEENIVTLYYRKAEKIPETGDQEETAKIAVRTAAAGIAVLLLLAVRKKKRLALK